MIYIYITYKLEQLGLLAKVITGNTPSTKYQEFYGGNVLWAGPSDFGEQKTITSTKKTLTELGLRNGKARLVKKGSVMLVAIGATIGKVGIAGQDMTTNQQINSFETGSRLNNEFLYYYFRKISDFFYNQSSKTTLPILNKTQCEQIQIPLPPLAIQQKIVSHLDKRFTHINHLKSEYEQQLTHLKALKSSILQSAFSQ